MNRLTKLASACVFAMGVIGGAQAADATGSANLVAVLRESAGANKQDETLQPYGSVVMQLADGREMTIEASWFHYLGDMHIRLVFDGPQTLQSATPQDLKRLRLTTAQAMALASRNLRRLYGEPQVEPWDGRLMQVTGRATDLASSYFLDRDFWTALSRDHPEGLVAAVPLRGGLVYAPAADEEAVSRLRFSVVALHAGARGRRVSSGLYLFKDGRWSVYQPPMAY